MYVWCPLCIPQKKFLLIDVVLTDKNGKSIFVNNDDDDGHVHLGHHIMQKVRRMTRLGMVYCMYNEYGIHSPGQADPVLVRYLREDKKVLPADGPSADPPGFVRWRRPGHVTINTKGHPRCVYCIVVLTVLPSPCAEA